MNYDPNVINNYAIHTVKITFGMWEYRLTKETKVRGNCAGLTVIRAAVHDIYDDLARALRWSRTPEEEGLEGVAVIQLLGENGHTLTCEDDEDRGTDWLEKLVISAEITNLEPEAKAPSRP